MASRFSTLAAAVLAALLSTAASASEPPCRREADGRVSCEPDGFARLTRSALEANARADELELRLSDVRRQLEDRTRDLGLCEAEPVIEPEPPRSSVLPLVGLVVGVAGALAAGASGAWIARDGAPSTAPVIVGVAGLGAVVLGAVAVSW